MTKGMKITVAGAGALGLASALALADAGGQVTVLDPAPPGANASGVAAGMLAPVFEAALDAEAAAHFDLLLHARDLWPALAERAGIFVDRAGALGVGSRDWLAEVGARMARLGARPTEVPQGAAQGLAPGLAPLGAALLMREDWRLEPVAALVALRRAAEAAGVVFEAAAATGATAADRLVIATGAALGLAETAPELTRLSPIKGHILSVELPGAGGVTVRGEGIYAVPSGGGLRIGATMERGVSDPAVDPAQAGPLATAGAVLFPAVAGGARRLAAGVRAAAPDGLPLVGRSSGGAVLAVGARRNGWLLAPLVAQLVVACVLGRDPGPFAARLDPTRFGL